MKTNLFSLAKVVLASVASVVSMSSCSKSDDPYVIDNPTPKSIVQSAKQASTQTQKTEFQACGLSEEFQYVDIIATTKDGKSYKLVASAPKTEIRQTDDGTICEILAADFHPTGEYTPVTVTFQKKEGITLPEKLSLMLNFYNEKFVALSGNSSLVCHVGLSSDKLDEVLKRDNSKMEKIETSLNKNGKLVVVR